MKVDLRKRTLKCGSKYLIKEGKVMDGYEIPAVDMDLRQVLMCIEYLYQKYRYSMPSRKEKESKYFKALSFDELPCLNGMPRYKARQNLEKFVLDMIVSGKLYWDNEVMGGTWFWNSKNCPDLVLLKDWIA